MEHGTDISQSHIIARDFFPGLLESKCQQELLDAIEMGDDDRIAIAQRKLAEIRTPAAQRRLGTPREATPRQRPASVDRGTGTDSAEKKEAPISTKMSLDKFQSTYTSEDNASFNTLLDKQNEKKREKHPWLWNGNKLPSKQQIAQAKVLEDKKLRGLIEDGSAKHLLASEDTRKAMPETWKSNPLNQLMFMPEGVETPTVSADPRLANLAPKSINHANTRLPDATTESNIPASPSLSAIHDAISGNPRAGSSVLGGGETPRVRGYGFVSTPSPADLMASRESTPMMPRERESTPSHNPFKISSMSRREQLHHRIVDKTARNKRAASQARTPLQVQGGATPRAMTPAAARLLTQMTKSRSGSGFGGNIFERKATDVDPKGRWLPTPRMSGGATPSMKK